MLVNYVLATWTLPQSTISPNIRVILHIKNTMFRYVCDARTHKQTSKQAHTQTHAHTHLFRSPIIIIACQQNMTPGNKLYKLQVTYFSTVTPQ